MREGIRTDDGFIGLHHKARDGRHQARSTDEFTGVDVGMGIELFAMHLDSHDHFFHGGVASALAQAVDGALDLRCTVLNARKGKRGSHAEVVMAVNRDGSLVDVLDVLHQELDAATVLFRQRITRGIRDVDHRSASSDDRFDHFCKEFIVGTTRIFAVEFDIFNVLLGVFRGVHRALENGLGRGAQLIEDVAVRNTDARMDARARTIDVLLHGARERTDDRLIAYFGRDLLHALEIARR